MLIQRNLHCLTEGEIGHVVVFNQRKRSFSASVEELLARLKVVLLRIARWQQMADYLAFRIQHLHTWLAFCVSLKHNPVPTCRIFEVQD